MIQLTVKDYELLIDGLEAKILTISAATESKKKIEKILSELPAFLQPEFNKKKDEFFKGKGVYQNSSVVEDIKILQAKIIELKRVASATVGS